MPDPQLTRRDVLGGLAAAGLTASLPGVRAADKPADTKRIDVHHHYIAPELAKNGWGKSAVPRPLLAWSPARSIEVMDKAVVATAILSGPPGFDADTEPKDDTVRRARLTNDYGAKLVADHKGRFGLFAVLPMPHVDESLKEIEYALDTLRADGVFVWTNYGDHWLGEKGFTKVFDELNRRKAVVYTHPAKAPCCLDLQPDTPGLFAVELPTNTSRAIWSLISDGPPGKSTTSAATRYSDVTFIWSHAGGSLVGLSGQFLGPANASETLAKAPEKNSKLYHLRRFYYDTAQAANPVQMSALKALVGGSQIVFGSEYPVTTPDVIVKGLQGCGSTADELRAIEHDNALKFLPKWK